MVTMALIEGDYDEQFEFRCRVAEAGGFDIEHLMDKKPLSCSIYCRSGDSPKLSLYARFGIHMYNMLQGTNLQLSCVEKHNYRPRYIYKAYYITAVAKDPSSGGSLVPFQTSVVEEGRDIRSLACSIARPKSTPPPENSSLPREQLDELYKGTLPKWPSENAFKDVDRFYMVKKSELRKYDWIRMYMELAFLGANRNLKNPILSRLVVVKVAVETKENVEPRLNARNAIFYIKYRYYPNNGRACKARCGSKPPRDRIAVVRRTLDKNTLSRFRGQLCKNLSVNDGYPNVDHLLNYLCTKLSFSVFSYLSLYLVIYVVF
ncbi:unnamed protein product [Cochlearia groenlandica]